MVGRAEVVLRLRVVPIALLGRCAPGPRDRMPAPRSCPAAIGALFGTDGARCGFEDRRPWPAVATKTPPVAGPPHARSCGRKRRRRASPRVRARVPRGPAAARAGHARDVLSPEQGSRERHRRGGPRDAPAAAAAAAEMKLEIVHSTRYRYSGPIAETAMETRLRPMDGNGP